MPSPPGQPWLSGSNQHSKHSNAHAGALAYPPQGQGGERRQFARPLRSMSACRKQPSCQNDESRGASQRCRDARHGRLCSPDAAPAPPCCAVRGALRAAQGDHQGLKFQALATHWRLITQVARLHPAIGQIRGPHVHPAADGTSHGASLEALQLFVGPCCAARPGGGGGGLCAPAIRCPLRGKGVVDGLGSIAPRVAEGAGAGCRLRRRPPITAGG